MKTTERTSEPPKKVQEERGRSRNHKGVAVSLLYSPTGAPPMAPLQGFPLRGSRGGPPGECVVLPERRLAARVLFSTLSSAIQVFTI